jgi:hypothetical protein
MRTMPAHGGIRPYRSADAAACCGVINRAVQEMDGLNDAARQLVPSRNVPAVLDAELGHLYTVVCEERLVVGAAEFHFILMRRDLNARGS